MKRIFFIVLTVALAMRVAAGTLIKVSPTDGPDNDNIAAALARAAALKGKAVTIELQPGVYNLDRDHATVRKYHVSNTTSEQENATAMKHIALMLSGIKNLTIDGQGSTLLLDGEMTALVADHCENLTLRRLNIDNRHPTQVEMEVTGEGRDWLTARVHPTSQYRITQEGKVEWYGKGWSFTEGIAQWYNRLTDKTWRDWSPTEHLLQAVEQRPGELYLRYSEKPTVPVGTVLQVRDSYRDEVCALLLRSKNVRLEDVNFWFLGNFGVVGQYTDGITIDHCNFEPRPGSGRTNAGYADFLQVSGCKGLLSVSHCRFTGAHDDPINVHGTHLRLTSRPASDRLIVRFMHGQTFGFEAFGAGDEIQLTDANSLLPIIINKVKSARMLGDYEMELTLVHPVDAALLDGRDVAVENVTWTPEVHIADCYFSRIPTRGILLTTRRRSIIERCTFVGMQMPAILVCNDARSWFESGPVSDLTIRHNTFYRCGQPCIEIAPENHDNQGPVHRGISIIGNAFCLDNPTQPAIRARSVSGLTITGNRIEVATAQPTRTAEQYIEVSSSEGVSISGNTVLGDAYQLK